MLAGITMSAISGFWAWTVQGVENYQITLGGDGTETAVIGERAGPGFAYDEIVPAIERLIAAYLDLRESRGRDVPANLSPPRPCPVQSGALSRRKQPQCRVTCTVDRWPNGLPR